MPVVVLVILAQLVLQESTAFQVPLDSPVNKASPVDQEVSVSQDRRVLLVLQALQGGWVHRVHRDLQGVADFPAGKVLPASGVHLALSALLALSVLVEFLVLLVFSVLRVFPVLQDNVAQLETLECLAFKVLLVSVVLLVTRGPLEVLVVRGW